MVYDCDRRAARRARRGTDHRLHRVRSHGRQPPRRIAAAGDGAGAAAARRAPPDRAWSAAAPASSAIRAARPRSARCSRSSRSRQNVAGIQAQLARFLDFDRPGNPARLVNNADWLVPLDLMSFLRDVGKHFTVNYMIGQGIGEAPPRERRRHLLHRVQLPAAAGLRLRHAATTASSCTLQMGGSDQWGNITAGIDLMRKLRGAQGARPGAAAGDDERRASSSARPRRARSGSIRG